jgi:hypothetical protein
MKKIPNIFKACLSLVVFAIAIFASVPGFAEMLPDALIGGTSGLGLAMATAAAQTIDGTVTTEEVDTASPNSLRPEISQLITKIRPDIFPMDTILREVGNVGKCDSREYKYYSSDVRGVSDTVNGLVAQADTDTTDIVVDNVHIWLVDDVAFFSDTLNNSSEEIRAQVLAKSASTNTLTVRALNGVGAGGVGAGDYMPEIADAANITRIGNAKDEVAAQNTPYANMPLDTTNYVQIFMCQVEESFVNFQHNKEVEFNINDYRTDAIYDLRRQCELAMLFGFPKKDFYDPVAESKKDMLGGARHFITKSIGYDHTASGTNADFNSWARQIFTGNNGSYKRILFAGNGLVEWLMNVPSVEKQLESNKSEIVAGIKFKLIETYFGDILVRRHQSFDDVDGYTYNGIVLDLENVERRFREPTHTDKLELDKTGVRRVNAYRMVEAWTMAFRNPETHAWVETTS